jgi:alkanesulfonate monooxygenase SsuD/methylene tetrahydromethanopterin reductase-like flavin-dependent oxidoreductase (luciferase family)
MTTFGVHTNMQGKSFDDLVTVWKHADDLGYGWVSGTDHFPGSIAPTSHDAVAAHATIAATTKRARCGMLCYSIGFRHPVILASAAATVDHLSGGRAAIGIGSGSVPKDYEIYGIPHRSLRERTDMFEEGVACVAGLLREEKFDFEGSYFQISGGMNVRSKQTRLPLWIGTGGERRGLAIVARYADGWNVGNVSAEVFANKREVLHRHCAEIGRDPWEIICSTNLIPMLGADASAVPDAWRNIALIGTVDDALARIQTYVDAGADQINFHLGIMERRMAGAGASGDVYPWDMDGLAALAAALQLPAPS